MFLYSRPHPIRIVALACALALLAIGCGREEGEREPIDLPARRVLLLTVDTLRADRLSANGYDRPTTPTLDTLVEQGTYFERAYAPIARTTPSLASMLSGRYPHGHGVRMLFDTLGEDVPWLPELAHQAGYRTIAVVSNHILVEKRGIHRGFDVYDFAPDARDAVGTTEAVWKHVEPLGPDDRIFLWVHYIDPHAPYYPPVELARAFDPGYQGRYADSFGTIRGGTGNNAYPRDIGKVGAVYRNQLPDEVNAHVRRLYAADIRHADDAISALLEGLRARFGDDWWIVFASDHGEALGERPDYFYDHGDYVDEASLHVPLAIVPPPGQALPVRRVAEPISLVDVGPTLVDLMGLSPLTGLDERYDGRSLLPVALAKSRPAKPVFAESGRSFLRKHIHGRYRFTVEGRFRAIIRGEDKLVWTPFAPEDEAFALYRPVDDPVEQHDLAAAQPELQRALARELYDWMAAESKTPSTDEPSEPSADDLERLRSLGYVE